MSHTSPSGGRARHRTGTGGTARRVLGGVALAAVGALAIAVLVLAGPSEHEPSRSPTQPPPPSSATAPFTALRAPLPSGAGPSPLAALSPVVCVAPGSCVALGTYTDEQGRLQGVVETLSDGAWSAARAPAPHDAGADPGVVLEDLACPAPGSCVAVGKYEDAARRYKGLILTESNGSWTATQAPLPADAAPNPQLFLLSVACPASGSCTAVGTYDDATGNGQGLAIALNAGRWTATALPAPPDQADNPRTRVNRVACPAVGWCAAVGSYNTNGGGQVATWVLSAGTWTAASLPLPAHTVNPDAGLYSLSCGGVGSCAATGGYMVDMVFGGQGLLAALDQGAWTSAPAPLPAGAPPGAKVAALGRVACPAPGSCTAIGTFYRDRDHVHGVLLDLAGGTWSATLLPLPADTAGAPQVTLDALACPTVGDCNVFGSYVDSASRSLPLVVHRARGTASATRAPLPADAGITPTPIKTSLMSAACPTVDWCVAVGDYANSNGSLQGLIETQRAAARPRG